MSDLELLKIVNDDGSNNEQHTLDKMRAYGVGELRDVRIAFHSNGAGRDGECQPEHR